MKVKSIIYSALFLFVFVSCSTVSKTTRSSYVEGPEVVQRPVVADLEVGTAHVTGTAKGKRSTGVNNVKQLAIADALIKSGADVLIEPRFEITTSFRTISVTVTGYPATYKNFRPMEAADTLFMYQNEDNNLKSVGIGNADKTNSGVGKILIASGSSLILAAGAFFAGVLFF